MGALINCRCLGSPGEGERRKSRSVHIAPFSGNFFFSLILSSLLLLDLVARKFNAESLEERKCHTTQVLLRRSPHSAPSPSLPQLTSAHTQQLCVFFYSSSPDHPHSPLICFLPFTTQTITLLSPLVFCPTTLLSPPRLSYHTLSNSTQFSPLSSPPLHLPSTLAPVLLTCTPVVRLKGALASELGTLVTVGIGDGGGQGLGRTPHIRPSTLPPYILLSTSHQTSIPTTFSKIPRT